MSKLRIEPIEKPAEILQYWKREKGVVFLIVFFGILFNSGMILGPIYQGKLIDEMVKGGSLQEILALATTFVGLILIIQVLRYFKRFYIRRFANNTSATMRLMIYNNIMHKSASDLKDENTGDLMTKAISDVELCVEGMRKFTTELFDTGVLLVAYYATMLFYDVKITLLATCFIPVAMFLAEKLKGYIFKYTKDYRKKSSQVTDVTNDLIENIQLYRISGRDLDNQEAYDAHISQLQNKAIKANILENSMQPIYNVIAMTGIILVIYLGGNNILNDVWTVGVFSTYISIFIAMASKASKASKLFNSIQKSQVSWKRIKPYLSEHMSKNQETQIKEHQTSLKVSDLSFQYKKEDSNIIQNIHFKAKQGEIVGITGPVASGKSTLGLALSGLYDYLGHIEVDGKELRSYSEYERSQMIAYLGHKPELLSESIEQNITLGKKMEIGSVLKDVCFETDLEGMPLKEKTLVGTGGIRLSGGQQARIALARALLHKNKIIILDDPFSAIDMKTEQKIIENIKAHYPNSILILISHRLAIFSEIDQILMLHSDKSVEYGTHTTLMESSKLYEAIYNLQNVESQEKQVPNLQNESQGGQTHDTK